TVTFLDFGCVRRYSVDDVALWRSLARAVLDDDRATFRRRFTDAGFVASPRRFDWDAQWAQMEYLYRPVKQRPAFRFTHDCVAESAGILISDTPTQRRTAMRGASVYLNRLQWGLNSVLATLGAEGPWWRIYREALDATTIPA